MRNNKIKIKKKYRERFVQYNNSQSEKKKCNNVNPFVRRRSRKNIANEMVK